MKPKTIILLVVAVGCGLGASIMTSRLLADRRKTEEPDQMVTVVVAKARVAGWLAIKEPEKDFALKEMRESDAPKRRVTDLAALKDQRLNKSIGEEHVVLQDDLLTAEQQRLVDQLLPGQRIIAIKVNAELVGGGYVLPAVRVDVMCTMNSGSDSSAKLILQNMLVMAVDDKSERNPEQKSIVPATVTFAATPEEAARMSLGAKLGELRLLPRSPGDNSRIAQFEVKPEDLKRATKDSSKPPTEEVVKIDPPAKPPVVLPELPPVEEKPKPAPKAEEKPKVEEKPVVVKVPEPKKPMKHTMRIIEGTKVAKTVFNLDEKREEDEEEGRADPETRPEARPEPKPEKKPEGKPAFPTGGKSTKVGRTRSGW
ncbi:MAG: Flp pilus assembly protein CpaB [Gemmataceae bacterium]|nr:Flp pilus assembly protein CpaB [Gemmataceae bacterium]